MNEQARNSMRASPELPVCVRKMAIARATAEPGLDGFSYRQRDFELHTPISSDPLSQLALTDFNRLFLETYSAGRFECVGRSVVLASRKNRANRIFEWKVSCPLLFAVSAILCFSSVPARGENSVDQPVIDLSFRENLSAGKTVAESAPGNPASTRVTSDSTSGPYVGAGVGRVRLKLNSFENLGLATNRIDAAEDSAWAVFAGYRFSQYWSVEAAYIDFGEPTANFQATNGSASGNYRVKISGVSPNIVGTLPLGRVELFAKAGYYMYQLQTQLNVGTGTVIEAKDTRANLLYSAGLGTNWTVHFNARLEYQRLNLDNANNSDALWLTAQWKF